MPTTTYVVKRSRCLRRFAMHWYDWVGLAVIVIFVLLAVTSGIYMITTEVRKRIDQRRSWIPYYDQLTRDDGWTSGHTKDLESDIYRTPLEQLIDQAMERE